MTVENYLFWLRQHAVPNYPIMDKDQYRLVYSLLGAEGTVHFASNPTASRPGQATFAEFSEAVKRLIQPPPINPYVRISAFNAAISRRGRVLPNFWMPYELCKLTVASGTQGSINAP